jgi:hypothetical protein
VDHNSDDIMTSSCPSLLGSIVAMGMMTSSCLSLLGSTVATGVDVIAPVATVFFLFQLNGFKDIYYPLN